MLARRSRVDPLSDCPLGDGWKVVERDLDGEMSAAPVKCFFVYRGKALEGLSGAQLLWRKGSSLFVLKVRGWRDCLKLEREEEGCDRVMKLSELGSHVPLCPHRPTGPLDSKEVTETSWYKKHFASATCLEIETKHNLEVRHWEKRLQTTAGGDNVNELCALAQHHLKLYRQHLPQPGDMLQHEDGRSPLQNLETAAVHCASAIRLSSREARLHFLLGLVLEEQHYATEMYGLQRKADRDRDELSDTKSAARQHEILAVCKLHGFPRTPTVENQLRALDRETQQLKEQGQSSRADHVQTLHMWLSKKTAKGGGSAPRDEENHSSLHRALMKYLDAWSLSPDSWEYNLHVGRLLLLQGRSRGALQHLQSGLALRPLHPALRFFTGLALLQQELRASEDTEKEAALFLQQGLEHFVSQRCSKSWKDQDPPDSLSSLDAEFLRGLLTLGELQQRDRASGLSAEQVYHTAAVLAAQSVSLCVCGGRVGGQLEWVLLDAHFALLQRLDQQGGGQATMVKRCRALSALIGLSSIPPCQELLDMQEKTCQLEVVTTPRDGHALCLLGRAQLAQYDNSPNSEKSQEVLAEACLSFQASIELEDQMQGGPPPEQLTQQRWWQDRQNSENEKSAKPPKAQPKGVKGPSDPGGAKRGARRGRGGPGPVRVPAAVTKAPAPIRGGKAGRPAARGSAGAAAKPGGSAHSSKAKLNKSKQACCPGTVETAEVPEAPVGDAASCPVNCRSHVPRLGLARALSRSAATQEEAKQLYQEVISMAPGLHDAYTELVQLLEPSDPRAAAELYCRFPLRPVAEQSFHDAFITGEIVRLLLALDQYQHPQLGPSLVAHGKVMGLSSIETHMDVLDAKSMAELLRSVYARIHDRQEDDQDLQEFFRFRGWI